MNITVKKLKSLQGREGLAVYCHVYCDKTLIGIAHDDGNGGELDFQVYPNNDKNRGIVEKIIEYAKTLPKVDVNEGIEGLKPLFIQPDFEFLINRAIDVELANQEAKKQIKKRKKGIFYGKSYSNCSYVDWKNHTLQSITLLPQGRLTVQAKIDYIKKNLKEGQSILNADVLRDLGYKV